MNHQPFAEGAPFEASFENLAGKADVLTVNGKPSERRARARSW